VNDGTLELLRRGVRTRDLGGSESTSSFSAAVADEVSGRIS
jgi:isocitrate dehydrogenase (NAD+)